MPQSLAFEADALSPKRMLSFPSDFSLKEDVELLNPKEAVINPPPATPTPTIVQKVITELMGTYIFVFVGCASALAHRDVPLPIEATAMVWGLSFMVLKYTLAHISGAFMNPASSIAFAVVKKLPWKNVPIFIVAQITGSILASLNLRVLFHNQPDIRPAVTQVVRPYTPLQAVAWEYTITFILTITSSGVATDSRAHKMLFGVAIGATVVFNVIIAGDISGAAMNPARSIGPAVVAGEYKDLWVYIVGPLLGATTATLVYGTLRLPEPDQQPKESTKVIFNNLYTEPNPSYQYPSYQQASHIEKFRKVLNV
ncbi:probable aquaporin NIP-type [Rhododendron vialii]|uniref:probable aquaporin NIP-type n=1 Tax=Rhododendron vialii TaxID=182163 RepID=UPI0026600F20|nr:probable aquaporin NIP-type [Rhododendron vialii]